jgi:signal transduction histidine kinase
MRRPAWLRDSITRRFALAIAACATVSILLNVLVDLVLGAPGFPPPAQAALLDRIPDIVHMLGAADRDRRDALARAAATRNFDVAWYPAGIPPSPSAIGLLTDGKQTVATLEDGSPLVFTPRTPTPGFQEPAQWVLRVGILAFSILLVSLVSASRLGRPIDAFAAAARRFGADPNAPPMTSQGPAEMQMAIAAFNTMQSQVQRLVAGQAAMFAAISHDLRTPLTRMRLRGEFIEDRDQQARLFRDIDEVQGMVAAVLTFLRDNAADERTTSLDLAELLRSVTDDYADIGSDVAYTGPLHAAFPGRPIGLRRAFANLVDNAVKYGVRPEIELRCGVSDVRITIADHGPGIPADSLETVFAPFQRLEPSRNRNTGGMGLGLTSARAVFRAHGGDVTLSAAKAGGLLATVVLPLPTPAGTTP